MTGPSMNFLAPESSTFQRRSPTIQQLLLQTRGKLIYARKPVPRGTATTQMLTNNLRQYLEPDSAPFNEKAIQWYCELLLDQASADDMTGFDNGILIVYGMCPPCKLQ